MNTKPYAPVHQDAQAVLGQRNRYMIISRNAAGRVVYFEVEPHFDWIRPIPLKPVLNEITYTCWWKNKADAEKALTYARRRLKELVEKQHLPSSWDADSSVLAHLTLIKIEPNVTAVPKRERSTSEPQFEKDEELDASMMADAQLSSKATRVPKKVVPPLSENSSNWGFRGRINQRLLDEQNAGARLACGCLVDQCVCLDVE